MTATENMSMGVHYLPINIRGRIAEYTEKEKFICYNSGYMLRFTFDSEWDSYTAKTAQVRYLTEEDGWVKHDIVFSGTDCPLPVIPKADALYVGVYAGNIRTSTEALIPCFPSALSEEGAPATPPEDVYGQIMEKMDTIASLNEEKVSETIAALLEDAKESGEFDGSDGVSPLITITENSLTSGGGATISVTNGDGTTFHYLLRDGSDGYTPKRGEDYWTEEDRTAVRDEMNTAITDELTKRQQIVPEFASSLDELAESGDTSKLYVLPDGYIYAWKKEYGPTFTNLADPTSAEWVNGYCFDDNDPSLDAFDGTATANFVYISPGDYICISGMDLAAGHRIGCYTSDMDYFGGFNVLSLVSGTSSTFNAHFTSDSTTAPFKITSKSSKITALRFSGKLAGTSSDVIITKNEEITYGDTYRWVNTGHAFVPADYENRILDLEGRLAALEANLGK